MQIEIATENSFESLHNSMTSEDPSEVDNDAHKIISNDEEIESSQQIVERADVESKNDCSATFISQNESSDIDLLNNSLVSEESLEGERLAEDIQTIKNEGFIQEKLNIDLVPNESIVHKELNESIEINFISTPNKMMVKSADVEVNAFISEADMVQNDMVPPVIASKSEDYRSIDQLVKDMQSQFQDDLFDSNSPDGKTESSAVGSMLNISSETSDGMYITHLWFSKFTKNDEI